MAGMRFAIVLCALSLVLSFAPTPFAQADQPEAREVARINNCPPKKIEVYQQSLGGEGKTIYRVECVMPKTVGDSANAAPQATALLISCDQSLCELLRPVTEEKK
jgi:hypothetical protein